MTGDHSLRLVVDTWSVLHADATFIRHEVFVVEQDVPVELELDDMDAYCTHVVVYQAEQAVGTARLLPDGHVGRMAVRMDARGSGVGNRMLQALMRYTQTRGDACVRLNAQLQAEAFYARHGYVREGDIFLDAGIPHIAMRYVFSS